MSKVFLTLNQVLSLLHRISCQERERERSERKWGREQLLLRADCMPGACQVLSVYYLS